MIQNLVESYHIDITGRVHMKRVATVLLITGLLIAIVLAGFSVFYQKKVNILVFGVEGTRTDSMILVSIDTKSNTINAMSIPRDTYFPTEGHNKLGQKKLNARYGFKDVGGADGLRQAIQDLTGVKVDHYVKLDYDAVAAIVDMLGGVEVDVPFKMKYDDPYATPPLHIDFEPGLQVISGDKAMGYLRFRKSNDGKVREGDVQRIERQQAFLSSAADKALSVKLPFIAVESLKYVETDMTSSQIFSYASAMIGTDMEKVTFYTLPMKSIGTGKDGLSYFYHDQDETNKLMQEAFK